MFYIGFKHKSSKARRPHCGCLLGDLRSHAQSGLMVRGVMHSQFSWSRESCTSGVLVRGVMHSQFSFLGHGSHALSVLLVKGVTHVWCLG